MPNLPRMPFRLRPAWLIAPLFVLQFAFVLLYLRQEHSLHFWDYAMYANMALALFDQLSHGGFWASFLGSFAQNYNFLFTLPSLLSFALFGPSRDVFILTNFVFYFAAHQAALAFLLRRVFVLTWDRALLWVMGLCSLTPFLWYPLLQGYPDNGAAAALVAALGLLAGKKKALRDYALAGAALGLAIVLRRHYAYPALAVMAAGALFDWLQQKPSRAHLLALLKPYAAMGAAALGVLVAFEPFYLKEMLTTDFGQLYKSYERGAGTIVLYIASRMGLLLLALVAFGFTLLLSGKLYHKKPAFLVLLAFFFWLVLWVAGPAQAGEHYLIALPPALCLIGLYAVWNGLKKHKQASMLRGIGALFLTANTLYAFALGPLALPSEPPRPGLFSSARPPWVRADYDSALSLAKYLASTTTDQDKIVAVGSSFIFNQDLLRAAYTDVLRDLPTASRFIPAPETDSQQQAPLDVFATATVFVVASPTQYHLDPDRQKVVGSLAAAIGTTGAVGMIKDTESFSLSGGVRVDIYRRKSPTPEQLHAGLSVIRDIMPANKKWVHVESNGDYQQGRRNGEDIYLFKQAGVGSSLLFLDVPLQRGAYRLKTMLHKDPACQNVTLQLRVKDANGKSVLLRNASPFQDVGPFYMPFSIDGRQDGPFYLFLGLTTASQQRCTVALWQLGLEQ